jgi:hypothetical protein
MSDHPHGVGLRRRPGRNAPDADVDGVERRSAEGGSGRREGSGDLQSLVGQQIVRDTLQGTGLGALSPVVASHLVLTQANIDPAVLGGSSNREMQSALRTGEAAGHSWSGALQGMTGPVPDFARDRIETATGGILGPISGITGSVPGVARHAIDAANDGGRTSPRQGTDPRDQKPRDEQDLGHVFGALSRVSEEQFDQLLLDAGQQFLRGLGEAGLYDLMDQMGLLPSEEDERAGPSGPLPGVPASDAAGPAVSGAALDRAAGPDVAAPGPEGERAGAPTAPGADPSKAPAAGAAPGAEETAEGEAAAKAEGEGKEVPEEQAAAEGEAAAGEAAAEGAAAGEEGASAEGAATEGEASAARGAAEGSASGATSSAEASVSTSAPQGGAIGGAPSIGLPPAPSVSTSGATRPAGAPVQTRSAPARSAAPRGGGSGGGQQAPAPRTQIQAPSGGGGGGGGRGGGGGGSAPPIPAAPKGQRKEGSGEELPKDVSFTLQGEQAIPQQLRDTSASGAPQIQAPSTPSAAPANVGAGLVGDQSYDPQVQTPAGLSAASSGDGLVQSGVDAGAAAASVAVAPSSGTTAGRGSASGGAGAGAVSPSVRTQLNPAVSQPLAEAQAFTPEAIEAPTAAPQMPGVQGGQGGGGGGSLPDPTVPQAQYNGGGSSHLPAPQAPDVPADFAASGGQQARSQLQADAQRMQQVGPQVDGQIASEVAPQQQAGEQSIWDSISGFFSGTWSSLTGQSEQPRQQADAQLASSAGEAQAAVAAAQAQTQSESARQATMPVPAELSARQNTVQQAVQGAEQNAQGLWQGGPQTQLPTGATQGVQQASQQLQQVAGAVEAPDVAGTVGAVTLPDHGLQPQSFEEVAGDRTQFDASQIPSDVPALGMAAGGGGDAMAQIAAEVGPKVEAQATPQYQRLIQQNTQKAEQAHQQALDQARSSYDGVDAQAQAAIAQYDAVDPASEAAPFDAQAAQAYQQAQQQATQAATQMDGAFAAEQSAYLGTVGGAQGEFSGQVDAARSSHSASVRSAGSTYDASVGAAEQTLQQGHDQAMGTYQARSQAAHQGAQQTFQAENQAAQSAVQRHDAQMRTQLQNYRADADQVGNQARSQFSATFQQQQQALQSRTQAQIQSTQGQVDQQVSAGQQQVQQVLQQGQSQADAAMARGQAQAQAEAARANAEAEAKKREAENKNFLQKAADAVVDFMAAALDWIQARFEQAKNAIVNFLEQARQAALSALRAAKNAALGVLERVKGLVQGLITALADTLRAFVSAFASFLRSLIDAFVGWIQRQIQALTARIQSFLEAFQQVVHAVVQGLVQVVAMINEDLARQLEEAASGFLAVFDGLVASARAAIDSASSALQDAVQSAGDALKEQITQAEEALKATIDQAEAALHAGVEAAYQAAVEMVNTAYEVATAVVNTAFDLAKKAVVAVIDAAYGAIEAVAKAYTAVITAVLEGLSTVGQWIGENIVGPLVEFLKDPWTGIRKMFVSFWNGPWRDVLIGIALGALIAVVTVATGGLGLIACAAITGLVVGATAATVYGAGELGARRANVSLMQEGHTDMWDDGKPATIKNPDGTETQVPKSIVDPVTGQKLPNPALPENAWYFDTMGNARRNPNGSMSAEVPPGSGKFMTLQPGDFTDPAKAEDVKKFMEAAVNRDENGKPVGERTSDSMRSAGALAAQKGVEWGINGAVGAVTGGGAGSYLNHLGQQTFRQIAINSARNAALSSVGDLGGAYLGERANMAIEGYDAATMQQGATIQKWTDAAKVLSTSFVTNIAGDAIGGGVNKLSPRVFGAAADNLTGNRALLKDAGEAVANGLAGNVVNTSGEVLFGENPQNKGFLERFGEAWKWEGVATGAAQGFGSSRANSARFGKGGEGGQGLTLAEMAGSRSRFSAQNMPDPRAVKPTADPTSSPAPGHQDPTLIRPEGPEAPASTQVDAARKTPVESQAQDAAAPLTHEPTQARVDAAPKARPESQAEVDAAPVTARRDSAEVEPTAAVGTRSKEDAGGTPQVTDPKLSRQEQPAVSPDLAADPKHQRLVADGNAEALRDSRFRGDAQSERRVQRQDVEKGFREVRETLFGKSELKFVQDGAGHRATLQVPGADGKKVPVPVSVTVVDPKQHPEMFQGEAGTAAAGFRKTRDGYEVFVAEGVHPKDVGRALAHEMAEIRFLERNGGRERADSGVTAHEAGRVAELGVLLKDLEAHRPKTADGQPGPRHQELSAEVDRVLQSIGLGASTADARLKMARMDAEAQAGRVPRAVVDQLKAHLKPQLDVDLARMQTRVNEFSAALFTNDHVDAGKVLGAMRGMSEHEAKAFRDMLQEQTGLTPADVRAQLKGRMQDHDAAEAAIHLDGDPYRSGVAALRNLTRNREGLATDAGLKDIEASGGNALRWFDVGGGVKELVKSKLARPDAAMDVLMGMAPGDRARLVKEQPDLVRAVSEKLPKDGPVRDKWDALTSPLQDRQSQKDWHTEAQAKYLLAHLQEQLTDGSVVKALVRNREGAIADLDAVKGNPELYEKMLAAAGKLEVPGANTPREKLEQLLTGPIRGKGEREEAQRAQIRAKLAVGDLDLANSALLKQLTQAGLPVSSSMELVDVARLAQHPASRAKVEAALGGKQAVEDLVRYTTERRSLEHRQKAQEVVAAVKARKPDELIAILADDTGQKLRRILADDHASPADKAMAQFRLDGGSEDPSAPGGWLGDRRQLLRAIEDAAGTDLPSFLTQQLHDKRDAAGARLMSLFGSGDVVAARRDLLPKLAADGVLLPHDQIFLSMVGQGADYAGVTKALKGLNPAQTEHMAKEFQRQYESLYPAARKAAGDGPDAPLKFMSAVLDKELSGRQAFEAKRLLQGDPSQVYDPDKGAKITDPEARRKQATDRLALETKLLSESLDFESKNSFVGAALSKLQGDVAVDATGRMKQSHQELDAFMKQNAEALKSGDAATWKRMLALKSEYEGAAVHNDQVRSKAIASVTRTVGQASAVAGWLLGAGPSVGLAARGATFLATEILDHTRDRKQRMAGRVTTALGIGTGFLPKEFTDSVGEQLSLSAAQSLTRRGVESTYDWRDTSRHRLLAPNLLNDTMQSMLGLGVKSIGAPAPVNPQVASAGGSVVDHAIQRKTTKAGRAAAAGADPTQPAARRTTLADLASDPTALVRGATSREAMPRQNEGNATAPAAESAFRQDAGRKALGAGDVAAARRSIEATIPAFRMDPSGTTGTVEVGAGRTVRVNLSTGKADQFGRAEAGSAVAGLRQRKPGEYDVVVGQGLRPEDVSRALAHELSEIRFRESTGQQDGGPGQIAAGQVPLGFDSHDAGRLGELAHLLREGRASSEDAVRSADLQREQQLLVQSLGLDPSDPQFRAKRVLVEQSLTHLDPQVAKEISGFLGEIPAGPFSSIALHRDRWSPEGSAQQKNNQTTPSLSDEQEQVVAKRLRATTPEAVAALMKEEAAVDLPVQLRLPADAPERVGQDPAQARAQGESRSARHQASVQDELKVVQAEIRARDEAYTRDLAAKAASGEPVRLDQMLVLGMGVSGVGAAIAGKGSVVGVEAVAPQRARDPRLGDDPGNYGPGQQVTGELWANMGSKSIGQSPSELRFGGRDAKHTVADQAQHPTAQWATAAEVALAVAKNRRDADVPTFLNEGPIGPLEFGESRPGEPLKVFATLTHDGKPVRVELPGVQINSGMGAANTLTTERTESKSRKAQLAQADLERLQGRGQMLSGEQALMEPASAFAGQKVLGVGGGPTSLWAMTHAADGGATDVTVAGKMPRPNRDTAMGAVFEKVEIEIRDLVKRGVRLDDGSPESQRLATLQADHRGLVQAHVTKLEQETVELEGLIRSGTDVETNRNKLEAIQAELDPFLGSRVERNADSLRDDRIRSVQADIIHVEPKGGQVEVVFADGTSQIVDRLIPSIGADQGADTPGTVNNLLQGLPKHVQFEPVEVDGRIVGVKSVPAGIYLSGAAAVGATGNLPKAVADRLVGGESAAKAYRDRAVEWSKTNATSANSRGIVPAIQNVGDHGALMQEAVRGGRPAPSPEGGQGLTGSALSGSALAAEAARAERATQRSVGPAVEAGRSNVPESAGAAPSIADGPAAKAFELARSLSHVKWEDDASNCDHRALLLSAELAAAGIVPSNVSLAKPFENQPLRPPNGAAGDGGWTNHVAVQVDGSMIDPALMSGPASVDEWAAAAGLPDGAPSYLTVRPGSEHLKHKYWKFGESGVDGQPTTSLDQLPRFKDSDLIDSFSAMVYALNTADDPHSRERQLQAAHRVADVMNRLDSKGLLERTEVGSRTAPPWFPAKIQVDPESGRYSSTQDQAEAPSTVDPVFGNQVHPGLFDAPEGNGDMGPGRREQTEGLPALLPKHASSEWQDFANGRAFVQGSDDEHVVNPNDVAQGALGDCYFLAGMAAVARANPDAIERLVHDNQDGTFDVTLHVRQGVRVVPVTKTVDARLPVKTTDSPLYAKTGDRSDGGTEMWPALLEKALAMHKDSYDQISGGNIAEGFPFYGATELLTGKQERYQPTESFDEDSLLLEIAVALEAGQPVTVDSRNMTGDEAMIREATAQNVYGNHAYAPVSVDLDQRTVQLQNPWGSSHVEELPIEKLKEWYRGVRIGGKPS